MSTPRPSQQGHRDLNRRTFLLAGAGVAFAAACSNNGGKTVKVAKPAPIGKDAVTFVIASYIHTSSIDNQRVTVAFVKPDAPVTTTSPVTITFVAPDGKASPPVIGEKHLDAPEAPGEPGLPYLVVRHRFEAPGVYTARATYEGLSYEAPLQVTAPGAGGVPTPGMPMIIAPTPTITDGRGVNPICTRKPACPLHDVSLDAWTSEGRPLALLFSTPALCQSRLCGPTLDNLLAQRDAFGTKVRLLHVEIFSDLSGKTLSPTMQAFHLEQEPFLYLVGADRIVRDRLDNAVDAAEMQAALQRLTG